MRAFLTKIVTFMQICASCGLLLLLSVPAHSTEQPFETTEKFIGYHKPPYKLGHKISIKTDQSIPIAPNEMIWQIAKIETLPTNIFSGKPDAKIELVLVPKPPIEKINRKVEVGGQTFGSSYLGNIRIDFGSKGNLVWTSWVEIELMVDRDLMVGRTKITFSSGEEPSTVSFPRGYFWREIERISANDLQSQTGKHHDYDQITYVLSKSDKRLPDEITITHFISYWAPQKLWFGEPASADPGPTCEDLLKFGTGVFLQP